VEVCNLATAGRSQAALTRPRKGAFSSRSTEATLRHSFLAFSAALDRIARVACAIACMLLVATVLAVVVLRYGFGIGFIWLQDFAAYVFAMFLALSVPVCMAQGGHVRVDVISDRMPASYRRFADLFALAFFLIPVFGLAIWAYWPDLRYSWSIREVSVETGGLPGLFLVKTALPLLALLMIVQGVAAVLRGADGKPPA
jgi:TRAP-type mannitol/chloroaromatic compound transport system permease small subunit